VSAPAEPPTPAPRSPNWIARAVLTAIAFVLLLPPSLPLAGAFAPALPLIGRFGRLVIEHLPLIGGLSLAATALTAVALVLGGGRRTQALLVVAAVAVIGSTLIYGGLEGTAASDASSFSLLGQVFPRPRPAQQPNERVTFATVDGQPLQADVWWAYNLEPRPTPIPYGLVPADYGHAILFVHGGAFWGGGLDARPALLAALSDDGYPVFDVEYRLEPPARWDQAPGDVLCALAWVESEADHYGFDASKVVVIGESAGGNLALMAAYAPGSAQTTVTSSCDRTPAPPASVIAISPTVDLAGIWADGTLVNGSDRFPEGYIGGTPSQFPDRYAAASPLGLVRPDVPPTLMLVADNDSLVRPIRSTVLVDALRKAGADVTLITIPFADHGFDGPPHAFGEQLEESYFPLFISDPTALEGESAGSS